MENDAGDDPSSEIFHRRQGGRSGSLPGGGALVRATRVFYEGKRRSDELHLGADRTVGATRIVGKPAMRKAGRRMRSVRWLARFRKRSRGTARKNVRRAAMLEGRTRGDRGTRVCSWVGDTAASLEPHSLLRLNPQEGGRTGSPVRANVRRETIRGASGSTEISDRSRGLVEEAFGSRVRPEDRRKTICGPTPADAIALRRGAREATRRQRYAQPVRSEKTTLRRGRLPR